MRTITQTLNMSPGGVPPVIHVSQYDSDFTITFTLFSLFGGFTIESGTTARIRGTKASGTGYSADAAINISAKTVTVTGDAQMTAAAGQNVFEIVLKRNNKEISSKNFILLCERAALDMDTIEDQTIARELDNLDQFVEAAEDAADRAEAAAATISQIDQIREPLIALFRKVVFKDGSGQSLINDLISAFNGGTTIPEHVVLKWTALSTTVNDLVRVLVAENSKRTSILRVSGAHKLQYYDAQTQTETGASPFYPISIPEGAKFVTVNNIIENLYAFSATITKYNESTEKWDKILPGQWVWVDGPVGVEGQEDAPLIPYKWDVSDYNDGTYAVVFSIAATNGTTRWFVNTQVPDGIWGANLSQEDVRDDVSALVPTFYYS